MSGYWPPGAVGIDPEDYAEGQVPVKDDATGRFGPGAVDVETLVGTIEIPASESSGAASWLLDDAPHPGAISVVPLNQAAHDAGPGWLSDITDTGFTLNLGSAPAATAQFGWHVHPVTGSAPVLGTVEFAWVGEATPSVEPINVQFAWTGGTEDG